MNFKLFAFFLSVILVVLNNVNPSYAEKINSINVIGNDRISKDVVIMFSKVSVGSDINLNDLNSILKNIYSSNFFENVKVNFTDNNLIIKVKEYPIIESITIKGIKAKKIKARVLENLILKDRSSFNEIFLSNDIDNIKFNLQEIGYYFASVDVDFVVLKDNKIDLIYNIKLGEKAKIESIKFIGNKIYKDKKLKSIITSEESKFWKFISGKKFLNQNIIKFDEQLLKNFT